MTREMQAAVWAGVDDVRVHDVPVPEVPEGWALVRVEYTGICGTDLAIVHGRHPRAQRGLVLGHEIAGRVESAGAGGPAAGARVVVEPLISCGTCRACRSGDTHVCTHLGLFGIDEPGGAAQFVALPPSALHEVPSHVAPVHAALAEPLAVAVHAVRRSGMEAGDVVAVFGAGPIGILTALVARHAGASQVIVSDPNSRRLSIAESMGLTVVPPGASMRDTAAELTGGDGADTTFDTAAHPSVAAELTDVTRVLGRIVVVGVYKEAPRVDLRAVCFKEQSFLGVRVYTRDDVRTAIDLIAADELALDLFPVSVYEMMHVSEALSAASSGDAGLKVLLAPMGSGRE
ncbi:zinc-binding dehydrogenase [Isoptericola sp. BMS4]|uniref:zinc-dependent alcohol dehydrogenase n=1 Tax=Isoptericola sp. BMS4 TaxID=2527875 RepID=UPI001423087A|nr:alcohol dehydrogenase catalytic domain-containing protein [Isoptericola sp. BMS4]